MTVTTVVITLSYDSPRQSSTVLDSHDSPTTRAQSLAPERGGDVSAKPGALVLGASASSIHSLQWGFIAAPHISHADTTGGDVTRRAWYEDDDSKRD